MRIRIRSIRVGEISNCCGFCVGTHTCWMDCHLDSSRMLRSSSLCTLGKEFEEIIHSNRRYLIDGDLELILNEVEDTENHIVFLDGVTRDDCAQQMLCRGWLRENRVNRRLIVVTSMSSRSDTSMDADAAMNVREHFVSAWTLNEYFAAVEDDELFRIVRPHLDSSDDNAPAAADMIESVEASDHRTLAADDLEKLFRQSLVRSKYYFAGGSARCMFGYPTAPVVSTLNVAVSTLLDIGGHSGGALNQLFCRFCQNRQQGIISRYAGSVIAMFGGPALITRLAPVLDDDPNAAIDGWILEMYFFARVHKGGVTLHDGDKIIRWPKGTFRVVDPQNLVELPTVGWLKPHKYNQGGYDAVYIDKAQELVRFVQVARAHHNIFHIQYFHQFLRSLRDSASSFEVSKLEIFFVIEREVLPDFKFAKVTGQGLLAAYNGWEKDNEEENAKCVGIQGADNWKVFDW